MGTRTKTTSSVMRLFLPVFGIALLLAGCVAPANTPPDNSPAASSSGLACFAAVLPASSGNSAPVPENCDELCASRDAACVGAALENGNGILPLPACDHPPSAALSSSALACRCYRVGP